MRGRISSTPNPTLGFNREHPDTSPLPDANSHVRPRRRPKLHLDSQYEYYLPRTQAYAPQPNNRRASGSDVPPPLTAALLSPLLPQPMLDFDDLQLPHNMTPGLKCDGRGADHYGDYSYGLAFASASDASLDTGVDARDEAQASRARGPQARDKTGLKEIAQVIARSGGATETEILDFLLSESDNEEDTNRVTDEGASPQEPEGDCHSGSEFSSSDSDMDVDEDEDDEDEDDQELRTLYRYMNPGKYGNVDLAHPLCSPIEEMFGNKRSKAGFFDEDEEGALF